MSLSIIFGRFNSLTRALSPFTAGSSDLRASKFIRYSILGSILWSIAFALLGYIFAEGYQAAAKSVSIFIITATFIVIAILIGYRFMNKRKHVFSHTDFYKLVAGIISLYALAKLSELIIRNNSAIISFNLLVQRIFAELVNPIATGFFIILTNILRPTILVLAGLLLAYLLYTRGSKKKSFIVCVSIILGALSELIMKIIIHNPRPANSLIQEYGFSFPSGHATMACIFFLLFIYTLKHTWSKPVKVTLTLLSILLIILTGASRIYLGVHWFSDVIAGYALGIFWVSLSILAIKFIDYEFKEELMPKKVKPN